MIKMKIMTQMMTKPILMTEMTRKKSFLGRKMNPLVKRRYSNFLIIPSMIYGQQPIPASILMKLTNSKMSKMNLR